ncbi:TPA_asm: P3 [Anthurium amnicola virus 1]|uniref:P3 n=1 Tax=Anthurium amnicola virus 1 TaxID=2793721 RepID=A0A8D9PGS2_9RHAB|nr:P3 [Anthurium amnicola virus 1]DAF42311.1 TPA_asm: P3 [Anthurium amnicola virus 1]
MMSAVKYDGNKPLFGTVKMTIKKSQQATVKRLNFGFSLIDKLVHYKNVLLEELIIMYEPVITSTDIGMIDVLFLDDRMENYRNKFSLQILANQYATYTISGTEWCINEGKSPYHISINPRIKNITHGSKVGRITIIPHFKYTNEQMIAEKINIRVHGINKLSLRMLDEDEKEELGGFACLHYITTEVTRAKYSIAVESNGQDVVILE